MGAWIEININFRLPPFVFSSHPTMGAWIEIWMPSIILIRLKKVAPHDGCVD